MVIGHLGWLLFGFILGGGFSFSHHHNSGKYECDPFSKNATEEVQVCENISQPTHEQSDMFEGE